MGSTPVALLVMVALFSAQLAQAQGDPEAGEAQATPCAACHGPNGAEPINGTYPVLAGQNATYMTRQLELIQSGERPVPEMGGQLDGKSQQDLEDLAAYFAAQDDVVGAAAGDDDALATAQSIYRGGILEKDVAACTSCHSPTGNGNAPAGFPDISGQPVDYTIAQLTAYREGERTTDEQYGRMMRNVAGRLTDTEIEMLANYLRGLH
ncbi:MAG: c-type cytochrome [Pseudomonadota bacterium]